MAAEMFYNDDADLALIQGKLRTGLQPESAAAPRRAAAGQRLQESTARA